MHELRKSKPFRVIVGHININSVRNKFELLKRNKDNIDILLVSKAKLDETFPVGQLYINGYSTPYLLDRISHGGRILLYIREDIPSKVVKFEIVFEGFFVEINLRTKKCLLSRSYNPNKIIL